MNVDLPKLSTGCIARMARGEQVSGPLILQMLTSKRIATASAAPRYRIAISDGIQSHSFAMLSLEDAKLVESDELTDLSVIKAQNYTIQNVGANKQQVIIFSSLEVLRKGDMVGKRIGDPKPITIENNGAPQKENMNGNSAVAMAVARNPYERQEQSMDTSSSNLGDHLTMPIDALSPYQNKWVIRARVIAKSALRTYSNAKGEGKLFNFDMCDESGEIRATAFNQQADKFYDMIEIDKVYYISKCKLNQANKKFNNLRNDYEMMMNADSVIQECTDVSLIPEIKYSFVQISDIGNMAAESIIDVIGVCKEVSDLNSFTSKNGRDLTKREVTLVDSSNATITLTLWGEQAKEFNGYEQPVVLVKSAKIGEYGGGKTLGTMSGSSIKVNPDIPEGHKLRGWFDNGGMNAPIVSLSARNQGGYTTEWATLHEAKVKNMGAGDRGDYFQLVGFIHQIRSTNAFYKACAATDCNKKVVDQENGTYRCDKCNVETSEFKYRLLINMLVGDWTSNRWMTMFSDQAELMLGQSANEIGKLLEHDTQAAEAIFNELLFQQKLFKVRTKIETYQDVPQVKTTVTGVSKVIYKDYNKQLLANIGRLTGINTNP